MNFLFPTSCRNARTWLACLAIPALATGCQKSTPRSAGSEAVAKPTISVPVASRAPVAAKPAAVSTNVSNPSAAIRTPIHDQPSFALARVVSGIKRGTAIAKLPKRFLGLCNSSYPRNATIDWASGKREFGNWRSEFGDIFFDVLRDGGVNVLGDPKNLFEQKEDAQSAELLVGARIRKLDGKFCEKHRWGTGRPTGRFSGEFSVLVEWSVYSTLIKKTVARFETEGYFRQRKAKVDGVLVTFIGAFTAATESLLTTRKFVELVERKSGASEVLARPQVPAETRPAGVEKFEPLAIARTRQSRLAIGRIVGDVTASVVSVRAGGGHGSGFLIDRSGLLLTNEHVVKTARRVQVVFLNGLEVTGEVLRRDPVNDVALVRIPIRARSVLPLRSEPARRLEDVYAIGSPIHEDLAGTVTRGVVSAWRLFKQRGIRRIQADVPISGGNSGGPLLDGFGNVVGISVATVGHKRAQNLNWFVPINDAVEALNIVYRDAKLSAR